MFSIKLGRVFKTQLYIYHPKNHRNATNATIAVKKRKTRKKRQWKSKNRNKLEWNPKDEAEDKPEKEAKLETGSKC